MNNSVIDSIDLARFHSAARIIENDLHEAYFACKSRYGSDVAGVLLVAALRRNLNNQNQWPPPEDLEEKVNQFLLVHGLINELRSFL